MKAKSAGIPVVLLDRDVDHSIAEPGEDYVCFIGSNLFQEDVRAAECLPVKPLMVACDARMSIRKHPQSEARKTRWLPQALDTRMDQRYRGTLCKRASTGKRT